MLADAILLARKDLLVEIRARQALASAATLASITLVLAGLAIGPGAARLRELAPAVVWIALLYSAIAIAERFERIDRADDAFTGMWSALGDRRSIYVGRLLSLSLGLWVLQLAIWAAAVLLLDVRVGPTIVLVVPFAALASVTISAASALVLALVADIAQRTLLLPVLLLPLLVPTSLAGVQGAAALLGGRPSDALGWGAGLLIQAALFVGVGLLTFEAAATPD